MTTAAKTDAGRQRPVNEDRFGVWPDKRLYVVADGVGRGQGGEVASQMAVKSIGSFFPTYSAHTSPQRRVRLLTDTIQNACLEIFMRRQFQTSLSRMATTVAALHADDIGGRYYTAHVGDSRIYLIRRGAIQQLTRDHSLVNEMRDGGYKDDEIANANKHVLTRALGSEENVPVDVSEDRLEADDLFLLCSDGLTHVAGDGAILQIILSAANLIAAAKELIRRANEGGGPDNITVVLVKVGPSHT